ncbi:MAG: flagellar biosynthesis protein FlhF [Gammaproteobacteria bacterium]
MRIKGYFAPDMRQALRMIREEMGPDAVILSHHPRNGGVEITAAVDYDQGWLHTTSKEDVETKATTNLAQSAPERAAAFDQVADGAAIAQVAAEKPRAPGSVNGGGGAALTAMGQEIRALRSLLEHQLSGIAWGELGRRHPLRATLLRRLLELGLSHQVAHNLIQALPAVADLHSAWRRVLGMLAHRLTLNPHEMLTHGGIVALLGPTGVGKTTTVAKLAARFALHHGPQWVALITTDSYRVGAHEQLHTFGRIMDVPVRMANSPAELRRALDAFSRRRLVLIDTAGISQRDIRFSKQVNLIRSGAPAVKSYLVLSATTQTLGLEQTVAAFRGAQVNGCVITKLDEATSLGGVLATVVQHEIPLSYISNGQRVPEDLAPAKPHSLVAQAVQLAAQARSVCGSESLELAFGGMIANARC